MDTHKKKTRQKPDRPADSPGTLYIIATPIGNLEDITYRALRVLTEVDLVAAEDTRHTRKLLNHYKIKTPTRSYYKDKEQAAADRIIDKLLEGQNVGVVSDAGTPGISDPGAILVSKALDRQIPVIPIPGPSSLTASLSVAGIPDGRFVFLGFAPSRKKQRLDMLHSLAGEKKHLIFFEAPHRLEKFLDDCLEALGNRQVIWGREITKIHEEFIRADLAGILMSCKGRKIKGESVLIITGAPDEPEITDADIGEILTNLKQSGELTLRDAVKTVAGIHNLSRSSLYKKALKIWKQDEY